jgi:hypothetical protein
VAGPFDSWPDVSRAVCQMKDTDRVKAISGVNKLPKSAKCPHHHTCPPATPIRTGQYAALHGSDPPSEAVRGGYKLDHD